MRADTITRLQSAQISEASEVLGRAFWDDPLPIYVLPDEALRREAIGSLFGFLLRHGDLFGEVYTTAPAVRGAAIWLAPHSGEPTQERLVAAGFADVAVTLGEGAMTRFETFLEHEGAHHKAVMPEPHWFLDAIGVAPEWQGHRIGSELMRPVLARADADGVPCYLSTGTERNVRFYQRHGFAVAVEADLPGGPHYWCMRREPQSR
jgi:GNAT superfamily N-acetyltransferase